VIRARGGSVLVLGATGPFGTAFIQLARLGGAERVIAAGRNPERLAQIPAADGTALHVELLPAAQLPLIGFSATPLAAFGVLGTSASRTPANAHSRSPTASEICCFINAMGTSDF